MKTYLRSIWLTGFLVSAVAIAATACGSDDDDDDTMGGGGSGGSGNSGGSGGSGNSGGSGGSGNSGGSGGSGNSGGSGGSGNSGGSGGSGGATGGAAGVSGGSGEAGASGSAGASGAAGAGNDPLDAALARCTGDLGPGSNDGMYSPEDFCLVFNATCSPSSETECEGFTDENADQSCRSIHVCNAVRATEDNVVELHCGHARGESVCD